MAGGPTARREEDEEGLNVKLDLMAIADIVAIFVAFAAVGLVQAIARMRWKRKDPQLASPSDEFN